MQDVDKASDPPATVPERSTAFSVMILRPFGGSRICGVPSLSQRTIRTRPSVPIAVPKTTPSSVTNSAILD